VGSVAVLNNFVVSKGSIELGYHFTDHINYSKLDVSDTKHSYFEARMMSDSLYFLIVHNFLRFYCFLLFFYQLVFFNLCRYCI